MRISQETARIVAGKLTQKADENAAALRKEYVDMATSFYLAQIPKEVLSFVDKYPEYVSFSDHINFDGHGFNRESVYVEKKVVANVEGYAQALLELTPKISAALRKAKDRYDEAKKKAKDLKEETRRALVNLRTTKEIEKALPIALPFINASMPAYPVPAVNLTSLKNRLQKLQSK